MPAEDGLLLVASAAHTLDPHHPDARAVLVRGRRIAWVGQNADDAPGVARARRIDLTGATIQPGFVNAHCHLTALGLRLEAVDLSIAASAGDTLAALTAGAGITPNPVLIAAGWDETRWDDQTVPTADEVSRAVGGMPVMMIRDDDHATVVDRTTLRSLPLARARGVDRGDDGEPTGLLRKEAAAIARRWFIAQLPTTAISRARDRVVAHLAEAGVVSVHEMGGPHKAGPDDFDAWREGSWDIEVISYWGAFDLDFVISRGLTRAGGSLLLDGTVGSRSAALMAPYADHVDAGQLYCDTDELVAYVRAATARGIQVALHAIGDRAVHQAVTAYATTAQQLGLEPVRRARHRIEHALLVSPADQQMLADLGVAVAVLPASEQSLLDVGGGYDRRLGLERSDQAHPIADLAEAGVALAFGGDGMDALDPWSWISAASSPSRRPSSAISRYDALRAATVGGRIAGRQPNVGPLRLGQRADIAAFETTPGGGKRCVMTMVAGRIVAGAGREV